jgi:hypothetical protein
MMRGVTRARLVAPGLLALALAGCPGGGAGKSPVVQPAPVSSTSAAGPGSATTGAPAPKDPLAGSIFSADEVREIYRAEYRAGADPTPETQAERERVLKAHRLIDDQGREVPARARAYERALKTLAQDAQGWSQFVETLDR